MMAFSCLNVVHCLDIISSKMDMTFFSMNSIRVHIFYHNSNTNNAVSPTEHFLPSLIDRVPIVLTITQIRLLLLVVSNKANQLHFFHKSNRLSLKER